MTPFYLMLIAIPVIRGLGWLGVCEADTWRETVRLALAFMFLFTAMAHFSRHREELARMIPPEVPFPRFWITGTGVAQILGALGLLMPWSRPWAAAGLILFLVAALPANLHAARVGHTIGGKPHMRLAIRVPVQLIWIGLLAWSSF